MTNEEFWPLIEALRKAPDGDRMIKADEIDALYETIFEFGDFGANNFVQLLPHIKRPTVKNVAQAIYDLSDQNWMYDRCLNLVKDRLVSKNSYGNKSTISVNRYDPYASNRGSEVRTFLDTHAFSLTSLQKDQLGYTRSSAEFRL